MIRPATAADLPRLVELSLASFGPITWQRAIPAATVLFSSISFLRRSTHVTLESLADNDTANTLYRAEGFELLANHCNWFRKIDLSTL